MLAWLRRFTPRSMPRITEASVTAVMTAISSTAVVLVAGIPNRCSSPATICSTPSPSEVASPKTVANTAKMSTRWPSRPQTRSPSIGWKADRKLIGSRRL